MLQGILDDLYKGTVSSNEDGVYRGTGIGALILKPLVDEQSIESGRQQADVKRTITAAGEDPADYNLGPGATRFDAQGAVSTTRRKRREEELTTAHERSLEPLQAELALTRQQGKDNYNLALAQLSSTERRALEDRIEAREQRALELEYQRMRDRKEDRQYNERMEKLDRKDRILAMQNIAAGLASLGAAFAI